MSKLPRTLRPAPRARLTERVYHRCACCTRTRKAATLDVAASWRHPLGGPVVHLLPGARVCGICSGALTLYPSPEHVGPGSFADFDRMAEAAARARETGAVFAADMEDAPRPVTDPNKYMPRTDRRKRA